MIVRSAVRNPNTIYRRYKRVFQYLLTQRSLSIALNSYEKYYVEMVEIHRALFSAVTTMADSIRCLVGYTGIGKSTILRYFFQMNGDNPEIRLLPSVDSGDEGDLTSSDERVLYIPLFMDNRPIPESGDNRFRTVAEYFSNQLMAAARKVQDDGNLPENKEDFASFVAKQRSDLLEYDRSLPFQANTVERVSRLENLDPFQFAMMRLKWFLTKSDIARVILIVDDVESLSLASQDAICHVIAQSFEWLKDLSGMRRTWTANAIISLRPLTNDMLKRKDWYSAFYFDTPIGFGRPADLKSIFKKRFDDAWMEKRVADDPKEADNWNAAKGVFEHVYEKVARERGNFLVNLSNYNVRRALTQFENLLLNKRYFEPEAEPHVHPHIQMGKLNFTESAALRALGMADGTAFPISDTEISNIFTNQIEASADLLGVLVILAIYYRGVTLDYGLKYAVKPILLQDVETVCSLSPEQKKGLVWAVAELETKGLVTTVTTRRNDDEHEVEYIELMPKAAAVWNALSKTSVLTEMFRDDTYVTYTEAGADGVKGSQELEDDRRRLEAAIAFGSEIVLTEKNFVERCVRTHGPTRWTSTFGPLSIGKAILNGINESAKAIGINTANLIEFPEFVRRVEDVDRTLKKTVLSDGMMIFELDGAGI